MTWGRQEGRRSQASRRLWTHGRWMVGASLPEPYTHWKGSPVWRTGANDRFNSQGRGTADDSDWRRSPRVVVISFSRRTARRPQIWWHAHAVVKDVRAAGERRKDLANLAPSNVLIVRVRVVHDEMKDVVQGRRLIDEAVLLWTKTLYNFTSSLTSSGERSSLMAPHAVLRAFPASPAWRVAVVTRR